MNKRFLSAGVVIAALLALPIAPASAKDNDDRGSKPRQRPQPSEVVVIPAAWTLTDATCPLVPPGVTITGTGQLVDVITRRTKSNGSKTEAFVSNAMGTATDQDGNLYFWEYQSTSDGKNSAAAPDTFTGKFVDEFELYGAGPVQLHSGFVADFTSSPTTFVLVERSSFGDPFDFPNMSARCDPL